MTKSAICPTRQEDYAQWYQEVAKLLAQTSSVRGCMIIKPWGYGIWQLMQKALDDAIADQGHDNFYCPIFLPLSALEKEAKHVEGFAKECAVVTHHRLVDDGNGGLKPDGKLSEPLVVRPTSETIIAEVFSQWIDSHRDLPLKLNQWANVVRWEMRTRLFLRTSEFLWQEGHTAHADGYEARQHALTMLKVYEDFCRDFLAMPLICGQKSIGERFPGACATFSIEAMMQDGKALQAGTSHDLGENFSRAFGIDYCSSSGDRAYVSTTSWGVSTRLVGAMIMVHGDDDGLRLPPRIAPTQVVILPVIHKQSDAQAIMAYAQKLVNSIAGQQAFGQRIRVKLDDSDRRFGDKSWGWVRKGVPIRIEIGSKEVASLTMSVKRRDQDVKSRESLSIDDVEQIPELLSAIHDRLFNQALTFQKEHSIHIESKQELYDYFRQQKTPGFVYGYCADDLTIEALIKKDLNLTLRCYPFEYQKDVGTCIFTGRKGVSKVVFARAY